MSAIVIEGLRKTYTTRKSTVEAVRGIDLTINEGEIFALLGPNGAGKTTTVEILEGFRKPTAGRVEVLGFDPGKSSQRLREQIGIVLQLASAEPYLTVTEVLERTAMLYPHPLTATRAIELVGLEASARKRVKALSGGQLRRLDMAMAVIGQPKLLFLDEPTTGFDPSARREAWEVVKGLSHNGATVLLTTHYMEEAQVLADRVAVIAAGKIVAEGTPETIGGRNRASVAIRFEPPPDHRLEDMPVMAEMDEDMAVIHTDDPTRTLHLLTGWALQRGVRIEGLTVERPTLEDIYLKLVS